jgi:anti-sigma28 factor (negative regulator of flagellin synthesis)
MKASTVATYLHIACGGRVKKETERSMQASRIERPALAKRAAQRWPEERLARVEELQKQIEEGTYTIASKVIAECMLKNETHFI